MIQWVFESAVRSKLLNRCIVATDDERIFNAAKSFGAEVFMTSSDHASGTDRVAEAAERIDEPIIINIQGDEPLIPGDVIDSLVEALQDDSIPMASLMTRRVELAEMQDPNRVKVVADRNGYALYFSRAPIPHGAGDHYHLHLGMYGFQREFLREFARMPESRLETIERLEQLRVLEAGFKIRMIEAEYSSLSVDTAEDIIKIEEFLKKQRS